MEYAELHCHSYYSFHDGASSLEELLVRAKDLGCRALAITDHDNLCGAMRFAQLCRSVEMRGITGAEITLGTSSILLSPPRERTKVRGNNDPIANEYAQQYKAAGPHLTLLAKDSAGYKNLCRLITAAHASGERNDALSGCPRGELAHLVVKARYAEARRLVGQYLDWFGPDNYYIELQHNLAPGDTERNRRLRRA
jgi:error-prone DNA polymerase